MNIEERCQNDKIYLKTLDEIAKRISDLEDMPNDCNFYKTCVMVAQDLYGATIEEGIKIADIIQEKYL